MSALLDFTELPIGNEPADDHDAELRRAHRAGRQAAAWRQRWLRRAAQAHLDHHDAAGDRHVDRQTFPRTVPDPIYRLQHFLLDIRLLFIIAQMHLCNSVSIHQNFDRR